MSGALHRRYGDRFHRRYGVGLGRGGAVLGGGSSTGQVPSILKGGGTWTEHDGFGAGEPTERDG